MRVDLTIEPGLGRAFDVAVEGPGDMRLGQVLRRLTALAQVAPSTSVWVDGIGVNDASAVGQEPIVDGAVLRFGDRGTPLVARSSMLELRVVGGPDAGLSAELPLGATTIGRAPDCTLVLTDADVSRHHARVTTSHDTVRVELLNPTNRSSIDGVDVPAAGAAIRQGQILRLGDSFLALAGPDDAPLPAEVKHGRLLVTRRVRRTTPVSQETFDFPAPPHARRRTGGVVVPAAIGLTSGLAVAVVMHSLQLFIISIVMPLAALSTAVGEQVRGRRGSRRAAARHERQTGAIEAAVGAGLRDEAQRLRQLHPDAATIHRIATTRSSRLWERSPQDNHLLSVRAGTGDVRTQLRVTCAGASEIRWVRSVPVAVDLADGPVEVVGPRGPANRLVASMLCQLAVLCSPADLEIVGVFTVQTARRWKWLRWLPHLRRPPVTTMAGQAALASTLAACSVRRNDTSARRRTIPWLLILLDMPGGVHPGIVAALTANHEIGITGLVVTAPQGVVACASSIVLCGETGSRLTIRSAENDHTAVADLITLRAAEDIARALAPLVDRADVGMSGPGTRSLLSLLALPVVPTAADVVARWADGNGRADTPIGVSRTGVVDLDLVRDGPHALVAGTTGSGKSECLQALVTGLAASHPPDEIAFVLVDYKGGAAFSACARLPHVAGVLTDFDTALTERALRSLNVELRRREALIAQHAVSDLDRYRALDDVPPIPRLVIVVDEFAALADDAPDLLRGLVDIAQRGRSLGVHLVLATQRPAGVVSADIRANTSVRIALRMNDPTESIDVIGTPDAADIEQSTPGRAILNRAGECTAVQLARTSGHSAQPDAAASVSRLGPWRSLLPKQSPGGTGVQRDDLNALVDAVAAAANIAARPAAEPPWLPPLPNVLDDGAVPEADRRELIHVGLMDLPESRTQPPVTLDLAAGGGIVLAGAARSGRTSTIRAVALRAAAQLSADQLRISAIGAGLADLARLPHRRAVLDPADFAPIASLLDELRTEIRSRRGRDCGIDLLLVDDWELFVSASEQADFGRSVEALLELARQAHTARWTVVIAGDRSTLSPRVTSAAQRVFVLPMTDRADYGLVGIPRSAVPTSMNPGRALIAPDGQQVQFALPRDSAQFMCGYR